ncbi:hypothetical protein PD691P3_00012 [Parabacteroides phage PD691P3]|jgi:hypothetical protein|nr:hypothetical protein PD482P1_00005 [Parabacteroides phage PD482P1]WAX16897.1 hypothetical protein PD691P3_00012 [Parabacteroides phage PD691P3]WAX16960.1 hypothetical protein PD691P4_00016 [Parabacteroides phage PD691P4]WAX17050.1 hypothetical protein PD691P6_00045 [Parabacteroides phage PD691P6]
MATFENLIESLKDIREALEKLGLKLKNVPLMEWPKAILSLDEPIEACDEETKLYIRGIGGNPFWKELDLSNVYRYSHESFIKTMLCLSYDREKAGFDRMTIYVNRDVFLNLTGEEISSIQARGYDLILKK